MVRTRLKQVVLAGVIARVSTGRRLLRPARDVVRQDRRKPFLAGVVAVVVLAACGLASPAVVADGRPGITVIVEGGDPAAVSTAVRKAGGRVRATLRSLGAVVADVAPAGIVALHREALAVSPDTRATLASDAFEPAPTGAADVQLGALDPEPTWNMTAGDGVGVALIDTGATDSPDLGGRLVRGPDLSGEDDGVDHYGHGTFMAGLIAGDGTASADSAIRHVGIAPAAHIVSVKVAGRAGTTSLSRILEAIDWVVAHADEQNIRILNLSFGVDTPVAWSADPLSRAVEAAWASGITVVAAAGNGGAGAVASPGRDPWIITAGASDPNGTATTADDTVAPWSAWQSRGPFTKPDVLAPGVSVISLRAPGSLVDEQNPAARVDEAYFRGSGTSMAAALTSGVAAVVIDGHPAAVPDDVKGALVASAQPVAGSLAGTVDLAAAGQMPPDPDWRQEHPLAGDASEHPKRLPWSADGTWYTARWYTARWYTARWYTARWYGDTWSATDWSAAAWAQGAS